MTQYFNHFSFRTLTALTVIGDFHHYLMPRHRTFRTLNRHKNITTYFSNVGTHKAKIFRLIKGTYHLL